MYSIFSANFPHSRLELEFYSYLCIVIIRHSSHRNPTASHQSLPSLSLPHLQHSLRYSFLHQLISPSPSWPSSQPFHFPWCSLSHSLKLGRTIQRDTMSSLMDCPKPFIVNWYVRNDEFSFVSVFTDKWLYYMCIIITCVYDCISYYITQPFTISFPFSFQCPIGWFDVSSVHLTTTPDGKW